MTEQEELKVDEKPVEKSPQQISDEALDSIYNDDDFDIVDEVEF